MPRDYAREREYERENYRQLMFKVKVDEAEAYKAHLSKHGIKSVDWFRYALSLNLVPGAVLDGPAPPPAAGFIDDANMPVAEQIGALLGMVVSGINKLLPVESDISTAASDTGAESAEPARRAESALSPPTDCAGERVPPSFDAYRELMAMACAGKDAVTSSAGNPRARMRKAHMPSPSPALVEEWHGLRLQGMSFKQIAEGSGYDASTVRKRVKKHEQENKAR